MAGTHNAAPITPRTLAGIDHQLTVDLSILKMERRSGDRGDAVEACWRRIDRLLDQRLACMRLAT